LGLEAAPEYKILTMFLWLSAVLMLIVGFSLAMLVFFVTVPGPKAHQ
jgi:cytochrome c-type biogenesis protein CcmH/NrfF